MLKFAIASLSVISFLGFSGVHAGYSNNSSQNNQRQSYQNNDDQDSSDQGDDERDSYYNRSSNDNSYYNQTPRNNMMRQNNDNLNRSSNGQSNYNQSSRSNNPYLSQNQSSSSAMSPSSSNSGLNNPYSGSSTNSSTGTSSYYYNNPSTGNPSTNYSGSNNNTNLTSPNYNQNSSSMQNSSIAPKNQLMNSPQANRGNRSINNQIGYSDDDRTSNKYPQDNAATDSDRQLNAKIRDKISGWFTDSYKNVSINSNNGVVNISGTVKSNDDVTKLVKEIRKIDGVRGVNADLEVAASDNSNVDKYSSKYPQDRGATDADRQLNAKIRGEITGWFSDSYKNVTLNTANGVVNVTGTVKTNDDLTKLLKDIRKVDGVTSVNSNVQIDDKQ